MLSELSGISGMDYSMVTSEAAGIDGVIVHGLHVPSRQIPCTVYVKGDTQQKMYQNRLELISKLAPRQEPGELYYRNDYISVKIKAYPTLPANFTERINTYNKCSVTFTAPEPYWEGIESGSVDMAYLDNVGFKFPFAFYRKVDSSVHYAVNFGVQQNTVDIMYQGSIPAPVRITITGEAPSPKITNETTGEAIYVENLSLEANESVTIYTKKGEKSVKLQRDNNISDAFHLVSVRSKFWSLQPGRNVITYESADDLKHARVNIEWTNLYAGV